MYDKYIRHCKTKSGYLSPLFTQCKRIQLYWSVLRRNSKELIMLVSVINIFAIDQVPDFNLVIDVHIVQATSYSSRRGKGVGIFVSNNK